VLEDLHWSDDATLDFLSLLARRRKHGMLLVIGNYRPVELILRGHPLKTIKPEWQLHGLCTELPLDTLSEAEVQNT
jgi:predicted ATPase